LSIGTQIDVVMPQMGVSVTEGTITKWLKRAGETVALDEALLEISTDKVDTEVPSPGDGVVAQILVEEGETVEVGTVLAVIAPVGAAAPAVPLAAPVPAAEPLPPAEQAAPVAIPPAEPSHGGPPPQVGVAVSAPAPATVTDEAANGRTFVSPVVARIASEHGIDPMRVPGTGQGGRVTKKDILAFIESGGQIASPEPPVPAPAPATPAPAPTVTEPPAPTPVAAPGPAPGPVVAAAPLAASAPPGAPSSTAAAAPGQVLLPGESVEPMTAMRRAISDHMRRSLDTSAHVTNVSEVDFTRVAELRRKLKPEYERQGVNLTFLAFIGRAIVDGIADWPWLNAEIRGESIVTRSHVNLGVAVALEGGKGLIVPVVRNAQDLNLLGMARSIQDIAKRAREKKLLPDDVQGGTITITNPGGYGTLFGTPIISQPQVANVGVYAIVKRPVVVADDLGNDSIAIRQMMFMTVTYDHRLIDGAYAAQFARDVKQRLEGWDAGAT
jgi:pyruvate/2-oxoglutarate dehydrogenase complex dihydrolipoamide acyltransferase (E2) component